MQKPVSVSCSFEYQCPKCGLHLWASDDEVSQRAVRLYCKCGHTLEIDQITGLAPVYPSTSATNQAVLKRSKQPKESTRVDQSRITTLDGAPQSAGIKDITNLIERLDVFEEKAGIRLEALSASIEIYDSQKGIYRAKVLGELHPRDGTELRSDVSVNITAHDGEGRVVSKATHYVSAKGFFGFVPFEVQLHGLPTGRVSRLRFTAQKR